MLKNTKLQYAGPVWPCNNLDLQTIISHAIVHAYLLNALNRRSDFYDPPLVLMMLPIMWDRSNIIICDALDSIVH